MCTSSVFQEMGFTRHQAEAAIKKYGTVQAALDSLLAGVGKYLHLYPAGTKIN